MNHQMAEEKILSNNVNNKYIKKNARKILYFVKWKFCVRMRTF